MTIKIERASAQGGDFVVVSTPAWEVEIGEDTEWVIESTLRYHWDPACAGALEGARGRPYTPITVEVGVDGSVLFEYSPRAVARHRMGWEAGQRARLLALKGEPEPRGGYCPRPTRVTEEGNRVWSF